MNETGRSLDTAAPAETHMAAISTLVIDDSGAAIGLSGLDSSGNPILVTFPFELGEVAISTLRRAADAATRIRVSLTGDAAPVKVALRKPATFRVDEQGEHVLIAFDPSTPGAEAFALPRNGAQALAHALTVAAKPKSRLILPN